MTVLLSLKKTYNLIVMLTFDDMFAASMVEPEAVGMVLPSSVLKYSIYRLEGTGIHETLRKNRKCVFSSLSFLMSVQITVQLFHKGDNISIL